LYRYDEALIFTGRSENDFRKYIAHRRRKPGVNQRIFHPEFWCHVWDWVERRKTKPSTGLAGVILALRSCDHPVSVYGFSHNSSKVGGCTSCIRSTHCLKAPGFAQTIEPIKRVRGRLER
jgi:hypothetical protein